VHDGGLGLAECNRCCSDVVESQSSIAETMDDGYHKEVIRYDDTTQILHNIA
jgi:hypothetical protein